MVAVSTSEEGSIIRHGSTSGITGTAARAHMGFNQHRPAEGPVRGAASHIMLETLLGGS